MLLERQSFLDALHRVPDEELVEELGIKFALYEKELADKTQFLLDRLAELTVVYEAGDARMIAADALKEAGYRWEG